MLHREPLRLYERYRFCGTLLFADGWNTVDRKCNVEEEHNKQRPAGILPETAKQTSRRRQLPKHAQNYPTTTRPPSPLSPTLPRAGLGKLFTPQGRDTRHAHVRMSPVVRSRPFDYRYIEEPPGARVSCVPVDALCSSRNSWNNCIRREIPLLAGYFRFRCFPTWIRSVQLD